MRSLVLERNPLGTCLPVCTSAACNSGYIKVEYTVEYIKSISFQDWFFFDWGWELSGLVNRKEVKAFYWGKSSLHLFNHEHKHTFLILLQILSSSSFIDLHKKHCQSYLPLLFHGNLLLPSSASFLMCCLISCGCFHRCVINGALNNLSLMITFRR